LIDEKGDQKGIMGLEKAISLAKSVSLDLVEVSPNVTPPVCKIMDYGKHLYKHKKIDQAQRKAQKQTEVKGVRLSLRTGEHDLQTKLRQAQKFLSKKNLVKFSLILKGREFAHQDLAFKKMEEVKERLSEVADVDTEPKKQGNHLMMILSPKK